MTSLLQRLQTALSTIYGGNVMASMAEEGRKNSASHEDRYRCPSCDELVEEHEFIHEMKVCRQCWEDKHGAGYISHYQAEAQNDPR